MTAPVFTGLCFECFSAKQFGTERERDQWEQFHAHDYEVGDDV